MPHAPASTSIKHWALTLTVRTPSVWPHCLEKKVIRDLRGNICELSPKDLLVKISAQDLLHCQKGHCATTRAIWHAQSAEKVACACMRGHCCDLSVFIGRWFLDTYMIMTLPAHTCLLVVANGTCQFMQGRWHLASFKTAELNSSSTLGFRHCSSVALTCRVWLEQETTHFNILKKNVLMQNNGCPLPSPSIVTPMLQMPPVPPVMEFGDLQQKPQSPGGTKRLIPQVAGMAAASSSCTPWCTLGAATCCNLP